ncbi:MAG: 50S ribosome-binding GTPase [Selenomonadaceae bacterium]|nr:50S ribosome-binding GTPase [Selenomonadaceae bacterium]
MADFKLDGYVQYGSKLLQKTRDTFAKYKSLEIPSLDVNLLPTSMYEGDNAIKLVFVGQYSAGKSSIIKMLSGIDTEIGAGIKTQEAHSYKWNNLEIVDTPGIHTELRPDHDEKTYYQIDHAALLIFVVTNEGFDDRMGNHFRKLAIEQKRAKNMVLVVNKMDRSMLGNVPEQQKIIADDMLKVIEPYKPKDLYLSFLDTDSYFEWQKETDKEMKDIYFEQSGYEPFVQNLNSFVKSRGVLSKVQAPLETLKSAITNVIGVSNNTSADADIEALEEVYRRKGQALLDGKRRTRYEIEALAEQCAQKIKEEGSNVANIIEPGVTEETVKNRLQAAQDQTEIYIRCCEDSMINRLSEICEEVNEELMTIDRSNFTMNVAANLNSRMPMTLPEKNVPSTFQNQSTIGIEKAVGMVKMGAKGAAGIALDIPMLGNIKAAGMVKEVGHFFGYKFAPWGAVNVVKGFANVLGWIGIAYTAYQILNKVLGNDKEKEMRDNILKAQNQIRNDFSRVAEDVRTNIIKAANDKMEELTGSVMREATLKIKEFQDKKSKLIEMDRDLRGILSEVDTLMDEVQKSAIA